MNQRQLVDREIKEIEEYADWIHTVRPEVVARLRADCDFYKGDDICVYCRRAAAEIGYMLQHNKQPTWVSIVRSISINPNGTVNIEYHLNGRNREISKVWWNSDRTH